MYCRKCGAKLSDTAMFCISCGTPTAINPQTENNNTTRQNGARTGNSPLDELLRNAREANAKEDDARRIAQEEEARRKQEEAYLKSNTMEDYKPQYVTDIYSGSNIDGNNVELEREMMDLSKTGTKYMVLSNLERRQFSGLAEIIRGQ